jgi:Ca2+-binding EF-hand superfamily protein
MTEEELGAFFNKIDSDKDGIVTEEELTPELVPLINDPEEEANEASDNSQSDSLQEFISSTSQEAEASGSVTNLRSNSR